MYPNTIELVLDRIEAVTAFSTLFFISESYLTQGLTILLTKCRTNKTLLKTKLFQDRMFIPKFLFSIDGRIYKWLMDCGKVETIDETCMELVDFGTLIIDPKLNRYFCDLPDLIKVKVKKKDQNTTTNYNTKKRKSIDTRSVKKKVINEDPINEWTLL